jgi:Uma2 family endonuclease
MASLPGLVLNLTQTEPLKGQTTVEAIRVDNPIHHLDVDQFHRMITAEVFSDTDRVELIDGALRDMTPIGPAHGGGVDYLNMLLAPLVGDRAIVRIQGALVLDEDTELYPDVAVLKPRDDWYRKGNPTPADVLLVIEVADSSLAGDLGAKMEQYARAGIPRYWVMDVAGRILHDCREPERFGRRYRKQRQVSKGRVRLRIEGIEILVSVTDLFSD